MKILKLIDNLITPAVADKYVSKDNKIYLNLAHGTNGRNTWRWYAGMLPEHFTISDDSLVLDKNNYNIVPVYRKGKILKDGKGNVCYNIVIDNDASHINDILLLWQIPGRVYNNIKYELSGSVELIGEGSSSKLRGDNPQTYPAPIVEILGNAELSWTGTDRAGHKVKQTIIYKYFTNEWNIGTVERV